MHDLHVETPNGRYAAIDFRDAPGSDLADAGSPDALSPTSADGTRLPDVVLLHQIASSAQVWGTLGPALAEFCRPIAPDLCGHGRTRATEESLERLVADLPLVLDALGVRDPVLVLEGEELLPLFGDLPGALGASGIVVVGPFTWKRGAAAAEEYEEVLGEGSIDEWNARNQIFSSGTPTEREAFVEGRVAGASADWINEGVPREQLRAYVERQLRDTEDGWERLPRRPIVEATLRGIGRGPFGLDLYDHVEVPVWLAVGGHGLEDVEVDDLSAWAASGPGRRAAFLPGHVPPDSFAPGPLADLVHQMLQSRVGAEASR